MGCDGGTIPKRDELVRTKKKAEQKDKVSELNFKWRHCAISQEPLVSPVVACRLGKLYNKDKLIMGLLEGTIPENLKHIKSLKDVKELNLTENPSFKKGEADKGDSYIDHQLAPYICPLIGLEMNGKFKFCFVWTCGCVISERALKEIKSKTCVKCQKPYDSDDVVILNAEEEDLAMMKSIMERKAAEVKAEKKAKKLNLKVAVKTEETTGKAGPSTSANALKRSGKGALGLQTSDFKKTKTDYSIAKDPEATTVFKSLFTSSDTAKHQDRAHWITYNPFYN